MNNRSYIFWLATIFGVLIGIYLYFRFVAKKQEKFTNFEDSVNTLMTNISLSLTQGSSLSSTSTTKPSISTSSSAECPAGVYTEDISGIPYYKLLRIYLSSFSDRSSDGTTAPYCIKQLRWFDINTPSIYFNINSTAPPANILGTGLYTKNVTLIGPPSEYLANDKLSYELKPFTIFFYASLSQPDFTNDKEITIFRIYSETPNGVRLIMKESPKYNRTRVQLILGTNQNRYTWDITTSTLISNGNPSIYALTFDTDLKTSDKVATLYIGKSEYIANVEFTEAIKLSNSRMEINTSGAWMAILYSFGFIDRKLTNTEVATLGNYMYNQHTGKTREMVIQTQELQNTMNEKLNTELTNMASKIDERDDKIAKCLTSKEQQPDKKKKWNIFMPSSDTAVATDTEVCSGLKIPSPSPSTAKASVKTPTGDTGMNYHISYPQDISSETTPVEITPSVTPTVLQNTTSTEPKTYTPAPPTKPVEPTPTSTSTSKLSTIASMTATSGIEPPYYDEKYYTNEPRVLDESQGWMYSD